MLTRMEMKTKDNKDDNKDNNKDNNKDDNKDDNKERVATFFDMSEMSMLSFSRQPEI